ncbi:hypothetical protein C1703_22920 [Streptomyces sp. Go-475]|nr:hypothetical protein C1703_22920 [Streptomyces sp. Go-475]
MRTIRTPSAVCRDWELHRPPELEPLKRVDELRYRLGLPKTTDLGWRPCGSEGDVRAPGGLREPWGPEGLQAGPEGVLDGREDPTDRREDPRTVGRAVAPERQRPSCPLCVYAVRTRRQRTRTAPDAG